MLLVMGLSMINVDNNYLLQLIRAWP